MGVRNLLIETNRTKEFANLLISFKKEHFSKSNPAAKGTREYFSLWEIGSNPNTLLLKLESVKYGYVDAMVDINTGLISIFSSTKNANASRAQIAREVRTSFTGTYAKLRAKISGRKGGGSKGKKGFYLKHSIGKQSAARMQEALTLGLISPNFLKDLKRLDVGMTYFK